MKLSKTLSFPSKVSETSTFKNIKDEIPEAQTIIIIAKISEFISKY